MNECDYEHETFCYRQLDVLAKTMCAKGISLKLSPCLEKPCRPHSRCEKDPLFPNSRGGPTPTVGAAAEPLTPLFEFFPSV